MPFKTKDVLIVDATVIIGLLILLTFQSISSSFIENEASDFMREWNTAQNQYFATLGLLEDCKMLNDNKASYETYVLKGDNLSKEMEDEIKKNCSGWFIESLEQESYLMELDRWGYGYNYLQQRDDEFIYTAGMQMDPFYNIMGGAPDYFDPELEYADSLGVQQKGGWVFTEIRFANYNPELPVEESEYLNYMVTGPLYVNYVNVFMILPFICSAGIASFMVLWSRWKGQDEETSTASKWSVGTMGFGFIVLFFGLMIILYAFIQVNQPFLDIIPESTWYCPDVNESGEVSNCELMLEYQPMPPETRNVP